MEKKNLKAKQAALNANASKEEKSVENQGQRKATYEELNNYCIQLYQQNRQLAAKLEQMNADNLFKRLDYLFRVIEDCGVFDHAFVEECTKEIMQAMAIPEEKKVEDKEEK